MEPTLNNLLNSSLQWIFVGGKGGVGKTTTSCALATMFANTRVPATDDDGTRPRRVLLISTDPAHNLSDAFNQKIGKTPTAIKPAKQNTNNTNDANTAEYVAGVPENTLFAMEIDPRTVINNYGSLTRLFEKEGGSDNENAKSSGAASASSSSSASSPFAAIGSILKSAASTLPGIDELSVFAEILFNVQSLQFDLVIFDTAPTGHTLKMLALPQTLNTTIDRLLQLEGLAPMLEAAGHMFASASSSGAEHATAAASEGNSDSKSGSPGEGENALMGGFTTDSLRTTVNRWREMLRKVQVQFNDEARTCFLCVCIPEFLSVYETERLIQELMRYNIACDSIVVNQLVMRPSAEPPCRMCAARQKIQKKYLDQIFDLYEDFYVVQMPLMSNEVRGVAALSQFGQFLLTPYDVERDGYLEVGSC